jgi:hypothetical protein
VSTVFFSSNVQFLDFQKWTMDKFFSTHTRTCRLHDSTDETYSATAVFTTVELTGTKLAHQARAAVVRAIS